MVPEVHANAGQLTVTISPGAYAGGVCGADAVGSAGLAGGALYDGLVAAAARKHKLPLITCDRRAEATYRVLGVTYELLSAA